jgi:secreted PhoX family phosphatase
MTELDRRSFLKTGAAAGAGAAVVGGPFAGFVAAPAAARRRRHDDPQPELVDTPDLADGQIRLALPAGFQYRSFQGSSRTAPITLDDGSLLPGRHDGMAAFSAHRRHDDDHDDDDRDWSRAWRRGRDDDDDDRHGHRDSILIRNHEENGSAAGGAFGAPGTPVYDSAALGGTSTVRVTWDGIPVHSVASLSGTQMNCSGGEMPWGSWVTCEETVNGYDVGDDFTRGSAPPTTYVTNARLQKTHGWIFEVPVFGEASAEPITQAGRFPHESVAWDPRGDALYLSEDNFAFPSGFYKYVPPRHPKRVGRLLDGGTLYMLKVKGVANADLARTQPRGMTYDVEWVKIDNPSFDFGRPAAGSPPSKTNDEALQYVSQQGLAKGAAMFSRLEGTVYDHGLVYFTSTQGGIATTPTLPNTSTGFGSGFGQIWAFEPRAEKLHMLFESPNREVLDFPDNVTTSRRGTLVICEDGGDRNFLRGLTRRGRLFDIAQNKIATQINDEFAGSTFSSDGRTLFVNIQANRGLSLAIWGPWHKIDV